MIVLIDVLVSGACLSEVGEFHGKLKFFIFRGKLGDKSCAKKFPNVRLVLFTPGVTHVAAFRLNFLAAAASQK